MTDKHGDSGDRILTAASDLFAQRGYKATTTRAIAEAAGVNEVTLFRRFGSKQGILRALGERWAASMAGFAVESYPDPADTRATLGTLAAMEVAQAEANGAVAMRLAFDAASNPEVAELMSQGPSSNLGGLASYLAGRQEAGDLRRDVDPAIMAEAFFALTSTQVMSRQLLGDGTAPGGLSIKEAAAQLFELFWSGVRSGGSDE